MLYIFKIFLPMPPLYLPTLPQMEGEMAPLFGSDFEAVRPKIDWLVRVAQAQSVQRCLFSQR